MRGVAELLNELVNAGVLQDYAVFGAVAQMRYTEAVVTMDADVLVSVPESDKLDVLSPIYEFCAKRGHEPEGEAIRVGDWPVQFIPSFDRLTDAAIESAETADMEGVPLRVVRADYLSIIALSVGRAKDFARILALLEAGAVTSSEIAALAAVHELSAEWEAFKGRFQ
jgi:hypothetical protein